MSQTTAVTTTTQHTLQPVQTAPSTPVASSSSITTGPNTNDPQEVINQLNTTLHCQVHHHRGRGGGRGGGGGGGGGSDGCYNPLSNFSFLPSSRPPSMQPPAQIPPTVLPPQPISTAPTPTPPT